MRQLAVPFLVAAVAAVAAAQAPAEDPFAARLAAIVPSAEERAWRSIPWRTELRAALAEASRLDKPVLLWAMNGHPLGQT